MVYCKRPPCLFLFPFFCPLCLVIFLFVSYLINLCFGFILHRGSLGRAGSRSIRPMSTCIKEYSPSEKARERRRRFWSRFFATDGSTWRSGRRGSVFSIVWFHVEQSSMRYFVNKNNEKGKNVNRVEQRNGHSFKQQQQHGLVLTIASLTIDLLRYW